MNTEVVLPLDRMTVAEKLEVIDRIMEDFSRNAEAVPSPAWHGEELKRREEALKNGTDRFISLEEAEKRIREKAQ
jgi:putative addiction module component (TIGR02574 family)